MPRIVTSDSLLPTDAFLLLLVFFREAGFLAADLWLNPVGAGEGMADAACARVGRRHIALVPMRLIALFLIGLLAAPLWAGPEYPHMGEDIFDAKADGEKLIADALGKAQREDKRVLLLFGANWCPWCRQLHRIFETDPATVTRLREKYVLVYLDANTRHDKKRNAAVIARYGNPVRLGIPVLVVLERDGTLLVTQETGSLATATEEETSRRVRAFLDKWAR